MLQALHITREQLIDLGILVGTDFNDGIKGIGPKTALKLVQQHGRIEDMPDEIRQRLPESDVLDQVRRIFLTPEVTDDFEVRPSEPDLDGIVRFLCDEREFSRDRVTAALQRTFAERSLF